MEIMHTMASEAIAKRPKRRYYSPDLKTQVVAQCKTVGASVAGVALAHGINANIVHRWLREQAAPTVNNEFVALPLERSVVRAPEAESDAADLRRDIRVEVRRNASVVTVNWPIDAAAACAAWLRDWLR